MSLFIFASFQRSSCLRVADVSNRKRKHVEAFYEFMSSEKAGLFTVSQCFLKTVSGKPVNLLRRVFLRTMDVVRLVFIHSTTRTKRIEKRGKPIIQVTRASEMQGWLSCVRIRLDRVVRFGETSRQSLYVYNCSMKINVC